MRIKNNYNIMNMAQQAYDGTIDKQVQLILEEFPKGHTDENTITECEQKIHTLLEEYRTGIREQKYYPTEEDNNALTILFNEAYENCTRARKEENSIRTLLKAGIVIKTIEHALTILTNPIDDRLEQKENMPAKTETKDTMTGARIEIRYRWE